MFHFKNPWSLLRKKCLIWELLWSAFSPHFPAFGLKTERYSVFSPNAGKCGKMRNRTTPNTDSFYTLACSNANLTSYSLYYEPSKVWRYLYLSQIFLQLVFVKRSFLLDHFRCLAGFWKRLSINKCYVTCRVILGSVSGIFRHI